MATAYFYELITKMTDSARDQDHIEVIIHSKPSIPDRTSYILGHSKDSPLKPMITVGKQLVEMGAELVAIPCITAHYFYDELLKGIEVPILNGITETANFLMQHNIKRAGLMATDGTIQSSLFQKELLKGNIKPVLPDEIEQQHVMDLIYKCVKSNRPVDINLFYDISAHLKKRGAEVIILGCTELSLIKRDYPVGQGYLDVLEVLARLAVIKAEGKLKEKYIELL